MIGPETTIEWTSFGHDTRAEVWGWNDHQSGVEKLFTAGHGVDPQFEKFHLVGRTDYERKVIIVRGGLEQSRAGDMSPLTLKRVERLRRLLHKLHSDFVMYYFPWGNRGCKVY